MAGLLSRPLDPLQNPTRWRIFRHIQSTPGITFRELQRGLCLGNGTIVHHLRVLQRAGMIGEERDGNRRRLFDRKRKRQGDWRVDSLLRQASSRELVEWLLARRLATQRDVIAWSGQRQWKRTVTQARLKRLETLGLIVSQRVGRTQVYQVRPGQTLVGPPLEEGAAFKAGHARDCGPA